MGIFDAPVESLTKAKLDKDARDALPSSDFVFPKDRRYPIQDKGHALAALSYSSGTKDEAVVRAAVSKRYPDINLTKGFDPSEKRDDAGRWTGADVSKIKSELDTTNRRIQALPLGHHSRVAMFEHVKELRKRMAEAQTGRVQKAEMTTSDFGGAGEAPTSVSQDNAVCPECGRKGGKHKKSCKYVGTNPSGDEVALTKASSGGVEAPPKGGGKKRPKDPEFEGKHPRGYGGRFIAAGSKGRAAGGTKKLLGGKLTKKSIEDFQEKHGLQVDGVVGKQTAAALLGHGGKNVTTGALTANDRKSLANRLKKEGTPADKTPEPFSSSKTSNWVARAGGLPNYIQHVAHALVRSGHPESKAIAMAVGIIRNWSEGKGKVSPAVQAAAAKALAQWEKMKADTHVSKAEEQIVKSVSLDDPEVQWAMEAALRTAVPAALSKSLFTPDTIEDEEPMEKRFNPREPRDPKTGQWIGVGGVMPKENELAHQMVGNSMAHDSSARIPNGGRSKENPNYKIGKKVARGEKLTRSERKAVKEHVKQKLSGKMEGMGPTRYRDFAKVHGMDLKSKPKSKHPGKQIGNPGAKKPIIVSMPINSYGQFTKTELQTMIKNAEALGEPGERILAMERELASR